MKRLLSVVCAIALSMAAVCVALSFPVSLPDVGNPLTLTTAT